MNPAATQTGSRGPMRVPLTRENIRSGAYLAAFQDLPGQPRWSLARIEQSMHAALASRPAGQAVWLFAYGSLIWNPLFHAAEAQPAVLPGWRRDFCIRLHAGRGSRERPGRMLGLRAGGCCEGVAFRLAENQLEQELRIVWIREMPYGTYRPIWLPAQLASGATVQALAFTMDCERPQLVADSSVQETAAAIAIATGELGSNREYLLELEAALARHGVRDPYVSQLAAAVRAWPGPLQAPQKVPG